MRASHAYGGNYGALAGHIVSSMSNLSDGEPAGAAFTQAAE